MSQSNPISNPFGGGPSGGAQNPFQIVGGGPSPSPAPQSPFEAVGNQSSDPAPQRQQSHIPQPRQQVQQAQAPENPFQIVQEQARPQARPQPAPTGQLSQQPHAAAGGFEMKGFPPGPAPMNQLDTLGSEEPAPAADPFAGMDLPQISEGAPDPVTTVMEPVEEPTSDFSAPVSEPVQEPTPAPTPPVTAPLEPVQQQIPTPPPTAVLEPVQQTPTPPPTASLEPFQQQQTPDPISEVQPEPSPKVEAKPFVPSKPSASAMVTSEIKQLELRAIFGVDHELSHQEIMQRARGLPGIAHVSEVTSSELTALDTLREVASKLGLEDEDPIVMSCPQGFIDFLTCEGTTLAILRKSDYAPGVRETLFIVARELDKL